MPMRAIFISYRRDDSEGQAGRLYDDLIREFGTGSVFMDVAAIDPGLDFRKVIDRNVSQCGVLLALIGPAWLDAEDESGTRRLYNPLDFVRLETAAALKREIPVVPVLVAKARMPRPEELPDDLKELAYRNGVELTHARWDTDVQLLVKALRRHLEHPVSESTRGRAKVDPAPARVVETVKPPAAEAKTAAVLPPTPRPAKKPWLAWVVAGVVIGYATHRYRKNSQEEAFKVQQAAAEAAARQAMEDEKAKMLALMAAAATPDATQTPVPNPAPSTAPPPNPFKQKAHIASELPRSRPRSLPVSPMASSPQPQFGTPAPRTNSPPAASPSASPEGGSIAPANEAEPAPLPGCENAEYKSGGKKGAVEEFFAAPPEVVRRAALSALDSLDFDVQENANDSIEAKKKRHIGAVVGAGGERVILTFQKAEQAGRSGTRVIGETKKNFFGHVSQRTWTDAVLAQIACQLRESRH
jgi:hypothetical protein